MSQGEGKMDTCCVRTSQRHTAKTLSSAMKGSSWAYSLGNGAVLASPSWGRVLCFSQGIPSQGNTLLCQAGNVEQTVQTLRESLARQSGAEPMRPRGKADPGVPANTEALKRSLLFV